MSFAGVECSEGDKALHLSAPTAEQLDDAAQLYNLGFRATFYFTKATMDGVYVGPFTLMVRVPHQLPLRHFPQQECC